VKFHHSGSSIFNQLPEKRMKLCTKDWELKGVLLNSHTVGMERMEQCLQISEEGKL
jgi:hypothetical protein